MPVTIDRPGVKVIQEFQTTSPTILKPSLPACIVGPANQVIEAIDDTGAFVSDALMVLPARLAALWVTTPFDYTSVGTEDLVLSVNNAASTTVTFSTGPGLTPTELADEINTAAIPGLLAEVETSGASRRLVLRTTATGDNASIQVLAGTAAALLTAFGWTLGYKVVGSSGYHNYVESLIDIATYPDPRDNIDELAIDYLTVRTFINDGAGNVREVLRTETFLQGATAAVTVIDDGDSDNLSPYLDFAGAAFAGTPLAAQGTGNVDLTSHADIVGLVLRMSIDGEAFQTLVFTAATAGTTTIALIDALWGAGVATLDGSTFLELNSLDTNGGVESSVRIDTATTSAGLLTTLGMDTAGASFENDDVVYGVPFNPIVGDEVWVDGVRLGEITEVLVSPTDQLRLDSEQLLTFTGADYYIVAKGLDNSASTASRPSSDLIVDTNSGYVKIKEGLFRETSGAVPQAGPLALYLGYTALRLDVSAVGDDFSMLRFGTTTALEAALAPVDTQNPLALGLYFALLNAPGVEVLGLGLDDTTVTEPDGTVASYTAAFEYLESKDAYVIAPMTHDNTVGQIAQVHVGEMSLPENGLERVVILNPTRPSRKADTLVASTPTANVSGAPTDDVSSGIANLQALMAAAGVPGPSYTESDGVFIELENDTNKYLVQSISGGVITINNGPLSASNTLYLDGGGASMFATAIVDRPMTVRVLGGTLATLTDEATAYAAIAQGYADRRVICLAPDMGKATIDGLETLLDGYYMAAGLAGRMSAADPQQGFTNDTLVGFTGVSGSNDRYGELQLKIMGGGGVWTLVQEDDAGPVTTRHQLTTDMSTVEKREDSIRRVLDYTARTVRAALKSFVGGFNITTSVQDAVSSTLDGIGRFLIKLGVLTSWNVNALRQSESNPDELEVDVTVGVPYPLNTITVTLVI